MRSRNPVKGSKRAATTSRNLGETSVSSVSSALLVSDNSQFVYLSGLRISGSAAGNQNKALGKVRAHLESRAADFGNSWGVFEGNEGDAHRLINEAWEQISNATSQFSFETKENGSQNYTIDMGRNIGRIERGRGTARTRVATRFLRITLDENGELESAYPIGTPTTTATAEVQGSSIATANAAERWQPVVTKRLLITQRGYETRNGLVVAAAGADAALDKAFAHLTDNADSDEWNVFDGDEDTVLGMIEEAWTRIQSNEVTPNFVYPSSGDRSFTINLNRPVGRVGGRVGAQRNNPRTSQLRIVISRDNQLVSAQPYLNLVRPEVAAAGENIIARLSKRATNTDGRPRLSSGLVLGNAQNGQNAIYGILERRYDDLEHTYVTPLEIFDPALDDYGVMTLINDAWQRIQENPLPAEGNQVEGVYRKTNFQGMEIYTVEMGKVVGRLGGSFGAATGHPTTTKLRLVLRNGELQSARPVVGLTSEDGFTPQYDSARGARVRANITKRYANTKNRAPITYRNTEQGQTLADLVSILGQRTTVTGTSEPRVSEQMRLWAAEESPLGLVLDGDVNSDNDYLMVRRDHIAFYSNELVLPLAVSWTVDASSMTETVPRQNDFREDMSLPRRFTKRANNNSYKGTRRDRGHVRRSGEYTQNIRDNSRTYVHTNVLPQVPNLNRGPWNGFENYYREWVRAVPGRKCIIVAGGVFGLNGQIRRLPGEGVVADPDATWKTVVFLEPGQTVADINENTQIISVMMPNDPNEVSLFDHWADYRVSVASIESMMQQTPGASSFQMLTALPARIASVLRQKVDTSDIPYRQPDHF